jgi:hypothetical protein
MKHKHQASCRIPKVVTKCQPRRSEWNPLLELRCLTRTLYLPECGGRESLALSGSFTFAPV